MDVKKIGKLIASLRKKNGLTQQELGDKVGVGFRAVSKWERGINLPDIGILNELSKTLGITSDELLSGELKKDKESKVKKKLSLSIKITISVMISIIIIFSTVFIYYSNKTYIYEIKNTENADYYIDGKVTFNGKEISITINKLGFLDEEFSSLIIKNYEYELVCNNRYLFRYGYHPDGNSVEEATTVKDILKEITINYTDKTNLSRREVLNNDVYLIIKFINQNNEELIKEIKLMLYPLQKINDNS